jgi:hypothetical protein
MEDIEDDNASLSSSPSNPLDISGLLLPYTPNLSVAALSTFPGHCRIP